MAAFVPPYPSRLRQSLSAWARIRIARRNMLALWQEDAFHYEFLAAKIMRQRLFVCNSPHSVRFALGTHNGSFERKSALHRRALEPLLGDGLFVSDGAVWAARRRIVAPIVHISQVHRFAPMMVQTATEMRGRWTALPSGSEVDILSEMAKLTAEIICRTVFGQVLGPENARAVVESFTLYQKLIDQVDLASLIGLPDWFPRRRGPALRRAIREIHAVLDGIIARCRAGGNPADDAIIMSLIRATDPSTGEPLSDRAVRNEAAVLFMAGHETTANSLAWTWYLLSQSPESEERLHAEVDHVVGDRAPCLEDIPHLSYTRAVFEETLRLYPPVPFLSREAVEPQELDGTAIPRGSLILVSPWLLHRHKKLWDSPDHFIPERFLQPAAKAIDKYAYIPFAIGPRICPGLGLAMTEAVLCIATMAQRFAPRLRAGHRVEPVCRLTLRPGDHLPMTLLPRPAAIH